MEKNKSKYQLKQVDVRLRLVNRKPLPSDREIVNPEDAVRLLAKAMTDLDREHLFVINLDAAGHPLNYSLVSIGDVRNAFVSMQSLFKSALLCNASNILAVHNHPGGNLTPTKLDVEATKRMIEAGKLMNVPLVDHVVVSSHTGKYYSYLENLPELFLEGAEEKMRSHVELY